MHVVFLELEHLHLEFLDVGKFWNVDKLSLSEFDFQCLTNLSVKYCNLLKFLIPSPVATSLVHLRSLWVESCHTMKVVVLTEKSTQEAKAFGNIFFPKLGILNLPNLKRFCAWDCVDCS